MKQLDLNTRKPYELHVGVGMRRAFLIGLMSAVLLFAESATAKAPVQLADVPIEALAVSVSDEEGQFTVIDSRMDETATAAVFFGLIGAAVNSAVNAGEDEEKAKPLLATASTIDVKALVSQALLDRLRARESIRIADTSQAASHTLVVEIGEWGLIRRGQKPDMLMRPFLKMTLRILDARNRTVWGPQREHTVGPRAALLFEFTPDVYRTDMEALAGAAGQQVANKLIYR